MFSFFVIFFFRAKKVTENGIEYHIGAVIITGSEDNALYTLPKLATIRKKLALPDESIYFFLKPLIVATGFCSHFHGFKIKQDLHAEELLLTLKSLKPTFQLI